METLYDISTSIEEHAKREHSNYVPNRAIGRNIISLPNDSAKKIWLTNRECGKNAGELRNITGYIVGTESTGRIDTLTDDGTCVSKNTQYGRILSTNTEGEHEVIVNGRTIKFNIINSCRYANNSGIPIEFEIKLEGSSMLFFKTLAEIKSIRSAEEESKRQMEELNLKIQQEKDREKQEKLEREKEALNLELDSLGQKYKNATSFIRKQAELRRQPLLDKRQNDAKFSNLHNGTTLIIDGGPGTGKTTTLIQRLKLLIDNFGLTDYAENNPNFVLSAQAQEVIFNTDKDWIFFSPTELLRLYLKDNMNYEGLTKVEEKTFVWYDYSKKVARDEYQLIGGDAPFTNAGKSIRDALLICDQRAAIETFTEYYQRNIEKKLVDISTLNISGFSWKIIGGMIINSCKAYLVSPSIVSLIKLYVNLNNILSDAAYNDDNNIALISKRYSDELKDITATIHVMLRNDESRHKEMTALIEAWQQARSNNSAEEEDEEEDELQDGAIESTESIDAKINRYIRSLVSLLARKEYDKKVSISGKNIDIYNIVKDFLPDSRIINLASGAYFMKHFYPVVRGVDSNMLNVITRLYKAYRKEMSRGETQIYSNEVLKIIVKEKKNKPLHPDETSLLLGFINNLILQIYKVSIPTFNSMRNRFAVAYKELCRPVIGIDEATDYTILDYYAIVSFRHYITSSITLSGDKMQCLQDRGIEDWDDIKFIIPKNEVMELTTSYRQSQRILDVGLNLYQKVIGKPAKYTCYTADAHEVPYPIYYSSESEQEKADWMVDRILEVKRAYDFLPSIAIFINGDEDKIRSFKRMMENSEKLEDNAIEVKDCSSGDVLNRNDTVRLFPLSKVKGMEFEVVFFHNLDELASNGNNRLMDKYLYVGLSRATFYMGITLCSTESEAIKELLPLFRAEDWANNG